jgi:hypothetical protein
LRSSQSHPPKAAQLSSSTSTVRASSSRRPQTHARSASSPAVALDVVTSALTGQHPPRSRIKADVLPSKLPDSIQTSSQAVRSSSVVERKRVVSMLAAVRPIIPKAVSERGRAIPASIHSVRRPQPVDETRRPTQTTLVVARRVPISELQSKPEADKAIRAHPRIDNSASTPAIRHTPIALAEASKPPAPRAPNNYGSSGGFATKQKNKEPTKERISLTKPTLSQISRAKTIERRVPVPTASKPLWGKSAPRKAPVLPASGGPSAPTASDDPTVDSGPQPGGTDPRDQETTTQDDTIGDQDNTCSVHDATTAVKQEPSQSQTPNAEHSDVTETLPPSILGLSTPRKVENNALEKTPISELLLSIERGFLFTPSAPLSPPQSYASPATLPIPFPLVWSSSEQQNDESGEIINKQGIRHLDSRQALGDVAINK